MTLVLTDVEEAKELGRFDREETLHEHLLLAIRKTPLLLCLLPPSHISQAYDDGEDASLLLSLSIHI